MRQIVLDTETTGISPKQGHRIIEIGCVELFDRKLTGNHYHVYLNPERKVDEGAFKVHGIADDFLADKPKFSEVSDEFLAYIEGAELIIHNAPFDVGFINAEFALLSKKLKPVEKYCAILDTLVMAKQRHPGQKNNLDALCKRYGVDNSNRALHGALLDAEILALVYLSMTGGQTSLFDEAQAKQAHSDLSASFVVNKLAARVDLPILHATEEELRSHKLLSDKISQQSGINLWEGVD